METNKMALCLEAKHYKKLQCMAGSLLFNWVRSSHGNGRCLRLDMLAGERL